MKLESTVAQLRLRNDRREMETWFLKRIAVKNDEIRYYDYVIIMLRVRSNVRGEFNVRVLALSTEEISEWTE